MSRAETLTRCPIDYCGNPHPADVTCHDANAPRVATVLDERAKSIAHISTCSTCSGTGIVYPNFAPPSGEPCQTCEGNGSVPTDGRGRIVRPVSAMLQRWA